MTDFVVITPKDIATLADAIIERAAQGTAKSKSAVLNMIAATFMGPKHNWGFITGNPVEYLHSQRSSAKIDNVTSVKVSPMSDAIQAAAQLANIEVKDVPATRAEPQDLIGMPSYPLAFDPDQVVTIARFAEGLTSERDLRIQAGDAGYAVRFVNLEDLTLSAFNEFGSEMFDTGENTVCVYKVTNKAIPAILREFGVYLKKINDAPLFNRRAVVVNDSIKDLSRVLLRHMPQIFDFMDHIELSQEHVAPTEHKPLFAPFADVVAKTHGKIILLTGDDSSKAISRINEAASWHKKKVNELRLAGLPTETILKDTPYSEFLLNDTWRPEDDENVITVYPDVNELDDPSLEALVAVLLDYYYGLDHRPGNIVFTGTDVAAIEERFRAFGPVLTDHITRVPVTPVS